MAKASNALGVKEEGAMQNGGHAETPRTWFQTTAEKKKAASKSLLVVLFGLRGTVCLVSESQRLTDRSNGKAKERHAKGKETVKSTSVLLIRIHVACLALHCRRKAELTMNFGRWLRSKPGWPSGRRGQVVSEHSTKTLEVEVCCPLLVSAAHICMALLLGNGKHQGGKKKGRKSAFTQELTSTGRKSVKGFRYQ